MIKGYGKGIRKRKQILRIFYNIGLILVQNRMDATTRHNIFVECVQEAKRKIGAIEVKAAGGDTKDIDKVTALAQNIFNERVLETYPEWFRGVKL